MNLGKLRAVKGLIIKGIGGSYSVYAEEKIIECKPKGVFRKIGIKPIIGDNAEIELLTENTGLISKIYERQSVLIRPEIANATQAMLVFAASHPDPSFCMLDRFLVNMEMAHMKTIIVFNKDDICTPEKKEEICDVFKNTDYQLYFISAKNDQNVDTIKNVLNNHITVLAGPSGVGKSTLVNRLQSEKRAETGELSLKIMRGKNTTRHSEMLKVSENSWIIDTPGFTSFDINGIEAINLQNFYPEIKKHADKCYFTQCAHITEPGCMVKEETEKGNISSTRYENYCMIYNDIKSRRKY